MELSGNFTIQSRINATRLDRWHYARLDGNGTFLISGEVMGPQHQTTPIDPCDPLL